MRHTLPKHVVRQVAVLAEVDERSVKSFLEQKPQRPSIAERVARALEKMGRAPNGRPLQPIPSALPNLPR
jgi:hypothetical protein